MHGIGNALAVTVPFLSAIMSATTEFAVGNRPAPAPSKCDVPSDADWIWTTLVAPLTLARMPAERHTDGVTNAWTQIEDEDAASAAPLTTRAVATSLIVLFRVLA